MQEINNILQLKNKLKYGKIKFYNTKRFMITCYINSNHCLEQIRRKS